MLFELLRGFKLYRRWSGGKWVLFKGTWYQAMWHPGTYLHDFIDCDDGEGMFHYTYSGVSEREDHGPRRTKTVC